MINSITDKNMTGYSIKPFSLQQYHHFSKYYYFRIIWGYLLYCVFARPAIGDYAASKKKPGQEMVKLGGRDILIYL